MQRTWSTAFTQVQAVNHQGDRTLSRLMFLSCQIPPGVKALLLFLAAPGMDVHLLEPKVTFYAKVPRCSIIGTFRASYFIGWMLQSPGHSHSHL